MILAVVLVPHRNGGGRVSGIGAVGDKEQRGDAVSGLCLEGEKFDPVALLLNTIVGPDV